mgnify:CR=1 FL=1
MDALVYIVSTLLSLYMYVLLLRFIMQLVRANFRNPLAQAILSGGFGSGDTVRVDAEGSKLVFVK